MKFLILLLHSHWLPPGEPEILWMRNQEVTLAVRYYFCGPNGDDRSSTAQPRTPDNLFVMATIASAVGSSQQILSRYDYDGIPNPPEVTSQPSRGPPSQSCFENRRLVAPNSTIHANRRAGAAWESLIEGKPPAGYDVANQVTLQVNTLQGVVRIRADQLLREQSTGRFILIEGKSSATAPLTANQAKAFPHLGAGGAAEIRGLNALKSLQLKPGTTLQFDDVLIVRPTGVEVLR